jgi:hypothetical protein
MEVGINKADNNEFLRRKKIIFFSKRLNRLITPGLVFLMLVQAILSSTVFNGLQVAVELALLLILLIVILIERRLQKEEVILLMLFLFTQMGSFVVNDLGTFMINAKNFGLAVFSLIYFRRHQSESLLIHFAFISCIVLILLQYYVFKAFPIDISKYLGTLSAHVATRPLGLFLSFHFSAFFIAICLIGYTHKRKVFFLDFYILWIIGVKTSFFSYTGQKVIDLINRRVNIFKSELSQWLLFIGAVILMGISANLIELFLKNYYIAAVRSGNIILSQLANPLTYLNAIYILPSNVLEHDIAFSSILQKGRHDGINEIALVVYLVQGGFFVTVMYLHILTKTLSNYRMFILLSLLHYSYILSPLLIYTMCMFNHKIKEFQPIPQKYPAK